VADVRLLSVTDGEWRRSGPTRAAVHAFGLRAEKLRRLPGGIGHAWTDGQIVVKPVGCLPEHDWKCEVTASWDDADVRVPEPVRPAGSNDGSWSVDGWGGHVFLPGRDAALLEELAIVRAASDVFHAAVRDLPRPEFMDARDDPWAFGDRLAWEDAEPAGDAETLTLIERLLEKRGPVSTPAQVIHGDILPNVLVCEGKAPGVIDWPPYFRPAGTANAIAATDAVTFRGGPLSILELWRTGADWEQLLIRALLYRLGPTGIFAANNRLMGSLVTHVERVKPVVDAVLSG